MINIDVLIKQALLAKDKIALNAYKNLKSELQKVLTTKNAPEYSEALFMQVTAKYAKSLEDAIKQFSDVLRGDLVAEYMNELVVIKKLLPEPVSTQEIHFELANWQIENGIKNNWPMELDRPIIPKKEMGNAIKYLKSKFPTADGKIISEIVKNYIV